VVVKVIEQCRKLEWRPAKNEVRDAVIKGLVEVAEAL